MSERLIIKTGDGSHSIYVPELNEHFHSTHGAINESMHVFIRNGLHRIAVNKKDFRILEIGYGTGLNAFLSCIEAMKKNLIINYTGIDLFPIHTEILNTLNYPELIEDNRYLKQFIRITQCDWNTKNMINKNFSLLKIQTDAITYQYQPDNYDLIFFDAFSPNVQPQIWSREVFTKLLLSLKRKSIFVTYSSKGSVKRMLQSCGFRIEKVPGPVGKREIICAFNY